MLLLPLILHMGRTSASYDDVLSSGIIFHKESKILLAEKFVNVQFLIPFPKYNFTMKTAMRNYLNKLSEKWRTPSIERPLDFSMNFNSTTDPFNLNWLLDMIEGKAEAAKQEAQAIRTDTSRFLDKNPLDSSRTRRRAPLIAAAAIAGIGLFGSGIIMGSSGRCGIMGIFGSCQDQAQPKQMQRISRRWNSTPWHLRTSYQKLKYQATRNSLRFRLSCLKSEQFNNKPSKTKIGTGKYSNNLQQLKETSISCGIAHKPLFSNQQINFNFDTAASLLNVVYADITSYKTALYAFKTNVLNSIPTLMDQRLLMSLVPRESLLAVIDDLYKS